MAKLKPRTFTTRIGIGGWTYAPWHETFFPADLPKNQALAWTSRQLSTIEINGTYYRTQTVASFDRWHDETPEDFVFSVKAPRAVVQRRELAGTQDVLERFFASGVTRLGRKIGPILWQFMPSKVFDADDVAAFFAMLPACVDGVTLRHAIEVRHVSFDSPDFIAMAREHNIAIVISDRPDAPHMQSLTADFCYVRLEAAQARFKAGYAPAALKRWADQISEWRRQGDTFVYVIDGHKPKAPAAALALANKMR